MAEAKDKGMADRREKRRNYGYIEELLKRKRERLGDEEGDGIFSKSRKTVRSTRKKDGDIEKMIRE